MLGETHVRERPCCRVEVPGDFPEGRYLRIDGANHQITGAGFSRVLVQLGRLVSVSSAGILTADERDPVIWLGSFEAGERLRPLYYQGCGLP